MTSLLGCLEYNLNKDNDAVAGPDTASALPTVEVERPEATTSAPEPELSPDCSHTPMKKWDFRVSRAFGHQEDLIDEAGRPFWATDYDPAGTFPVALPDAERIPAGFDMVYTTTFELASVPEVYVSLQSDDGLWVWINGEQVGHWGGDWQQEGCVNENAGCVENVVVPLVPISDRLQVGTNIIATRVSNAVFNSYFDLIPYCRDPS